MFVVTPSDVEGVAARQSGVVSRRQLLQLGLSAEAIKHRIATHRLFVVYRSVYAVGHEALSDRGRIIAALFAAGPEAVASHWTAAYLDNLTPTLPAVLDVTTTGHARRSRPTLRIHQTRGPLETRRRQGIPLTAPLRTLADLGFPQNLVGDALARRLIRPEDLGPGREPTRSKLERRLLPLIRQAGLPRPRINHPIGPYHVDFVWPDQRVIVETDGFATHGHRAAFEADRARDAALQAAGYVVLRFTHRQVTRQPLTAIAQLAAVVLSR
jgi:very-short-patch-repair endonuclease